MLPFIYLIIYNFIHFKTIHVNFYMIKSNYKIIGKLNNQKYQSFFLFLLFHNKT